MRQMIGSIGGVICILFQLFADYPLWCEEIPTPVPGQAEADDANKRIRDERKLVAETAGETLARLVLLNHSNC